MSEQEPDKLAAIVEEFADLEPRERLEVLLDYAEGLPQLPPELEAERQAGLHRVHECQTPVFLWVNVVDGRIQIQAYVAPEAPTVKGFVAILAQALAGATPEEVSAVGADLLQRLGLIQALGMVRARGLNAILFRIRQEAQRAVAA